MSNIFDMTDSWNNAPTVFTAIKMNVTDTASDPNSLLTDLQVGGVSKFSVNKAGVVALTGLLQLPLGNNSQIVRLNAIYYLGTDTNQVYIYSTSTTTPVVAFNGPNVVVNSNGSFGFGANNNATSTIDVLLTRDAANTLALRNGAAAQTFNSYNTFTDASNYERATLTWSANVAYLKPQNAGTGAARLLIVQSGSVTVANLPTAATAGAGARAFVSDSTVVAAGNFGAIVAGTGANAVPVYSDATNWRIG